MRVARLRRTAASGTLRSGQGVGGGEQGRPCTANARIACSFELTDTRKRLMSPRSGLNPAAISAQPCVMATCPLQSCPSILICPAMFMDRRVGSAAQPCTSLFAWPQRIWPLKPRWVQSALGWVGRSAQGNWLGELVASTGRMESEKSIGCFFYYCSLFFFFHYGQQKSICTQSAIKKICMKTACNTQNDPLLQIPHVW